VSAAPTEAVERRYFSALVSAVYWNGEAQGIRRVSKTAACTLESLAPPVHPVCDAAGSQRIERGAGELHFGEVFIPFMGRRPMRKAKIACHTKTAQIQLENMS
jgi:hypothetical protein